MISWKSKLKVLYKVLIVEFLLVGYLSTVQQPWVLQSIEENFSVGLSLVMSFKLAIIFFSFNYKEKARGTPTSNIHYGTNLPNSFN